MVWRPSPGCRECHCRALAPYAGPRARVRTTRPASGYALGTELPNNQVRSGDRLRVAEGADCQ
eukprot:9230196-Heterocapsa_arctica.AAC.1